MPNHSLYKLTLLLFACFIIIISCKNPIQQPKQVWLYKTEGAEILNGNVKELSLGDSLSKGGCYVAHFNKGGNMTSSFERHDIVSSHNNVVDTVTFLRKIEYEFRYDSEGRKLTMTGRISESEMKDQTPLRHNTYTSQWSFDRNGFIINCVPNLADTSFSTVTYKYDRAGNIIAFDQFFYPGKKNRHITPDLRRYKYDNEHHVTEDILLLHYKDSMMVEVKYDYKFLSFDKHHNWTKGIVHWNNYIPEERDSATWIETRKITYY